MEASSAGWSAEQVLALAPDDASAAAGRKLAATGSWARTGFTSGTGSSSGVAVWGECRGSGAQPYLTIVDLTAVEPGAEPAFRCSCPSRKFPCKHALALLLRWSGGLVGAADPPEQVSQWLAERAGRAGQAGGAGGTSPDDGEQAQSPEAAEASAEAARKRVEQRDERMTGGLIELEQWLRDQVRAGLAGAQQGGYAPFDALAARMVDAQLPGVASRLRGLAGVVASGEGWPGRLLEEYALLHVLTAAGVSGDDETAATIRAQIGVPVSKDAVLSRPPVRDRWATLAVRETDEEPLRVRRTWLRGERTGRLALLLAFAPPGQQFDTTFRPGTAVEADVHYYPGAAPLRALVGTRHGPFDIADRVHGEGLSAALAAWSAALAADPWTRAWPAVVEAVPLVDDEGWWLVDGDGSLRLVEVGEAGWSLLAASGGRPLPLLVEVVPEGVRWVAAP